jgi:hypothetical protein
MLLKKEGEVNTLVKCSLFSFYVYSTIGITYSQETPTIDKTGVFKLMNGINITKIQGIYRYKSGGVSLFGYIQKSDVEYKSTDSVSFLVCNTGTVIIVNFGDLQQTSQNCPPVPKAMYPSSASSSSWQEWKVNDGQLIESKGGDARINPIINLKQLNISDLPKEYQVILENKQQYGPAAVTFSTAEMKPILGIIEKNKM